MAPLSNDKIQKTLHACANNKADTNFGLFLNINSGSPICEYGFTESIA